MAYGLIHIELESHISHLLFHCHSARRQTGHHHLGAEH